MCVGKAHEEMFLKVLDGCDLPQGITNERRISFNCSAAIEDIWNPTIRTILCFQPQSFLSWLAFLRNSRLLKVLNGVGNNHKGYPLPHQVFELYHLTYLALFGSSNIPSAISNLVNLQTLIILPTFHCQSKRELRDYNLASHFSLPLEIWLMRQLRHLVLYDLYTLPDPRNEYLHIRLENLQTLLTVENLEWNAEIVRKIPNVKKLGLVYRINKECHLSHLKYLHQLEKLEVTRYHHFSSHRQNSSFPTTLKKLTLAGGGYPWSYMGAIGSLPNLQVLKLLDKACSGTEWEITDEDFPQLEFLLIDKSDLRRWKTKSSPFPILKHLLLRSCSLLRNIPEAIGEIPTLELIEVCNCRRGLEMSAEWIKEEKQIYGNDDFQVRVVHSDELGRKGSDH